MKNSDRTDPEIHPVFDGHLEKPLRSLPPKEKLLYLFQQIELRYLAEACPWIAELLLHFRRRGM